MTTEKIKKHHMQKTAFVYLRQSSPTQVKKNVEGSRRQRQMQDAEKTRLAGITILRAGHRLVGGSAKVLAELINLVGVRVDGAGGKVPDLHILDHALDEGIESFLVGCHGGLAFREVKCWKMRNAPCVSLTSTWPTA